jgi:hypothetical protein
MYALDSNATTVANTRIQSVQARSVVEAMKKKPFLPIAPNKEETSPPPPLYR